MRQLPPLFWVGLISALIGAVLSLLAGGDLGPDLMNYHFYSGFLALHSERLVSDIFPAGIQGYLNPYIYVLYYGLIRLLPGIIVGAIMGAVHGLNACAVYLVARTIFTDGDPRRRMALVLGAVMFGMLNPFFLAMLGTSFSDMLTPALILLPLALIMRLRFPAEGDRPYDFTWALWLLAGVMTGMAVGFKLPNGVYVFALIGAYCVRLHISRAALIEAGMLFGGCAIGFLLINGVWAARLWTEFANPFFPFFNDIFRSTMVGPINTGVPALAAAKNLFHMLIMPFQWAVGIPPESEWAFRDARYACLLPLGIMYGLALKRGRIARTPVNDRLLFISLWAALAFFFWAFMFGALRYLMPVTLVTGVLLLAWLMRLIMNERRALITAGVLAFVCLFTQHQPGYQRTDWDHHWRLVDLPRELKEPGVLYLFEGLSLPLPFLPGAKIIGIGFLNGQEQAGLTRRAREYIAAHQGPIRSFTSVGRSDPGLPGRFAQFGFVEERTSCVTFTVGSPGKQNYAFESCKLVPF